MMKKLLLSLAIILASSVGVKADTALLTSASNNIANENTATWTVNGITWTLSGGNLAWDESNNCYTLDASTTYTLTWNKSIVASKMVVYQQSARNKGTIAGNSGITLKNGSESKSTSQAQNYSSPDYATLEDIVEFSSLKIVTGKAKDWSSTFTYRLFSISVDYNIPTSSNGVDVTGLITNTAFGSNLDGWTKTGSGVKHNTNKGNGDVSGFAEICEWGADLTFSGGLSQTLTNIPNGYYQLDVYYQAAEETSNQLLAGANEVELVGHGLGWTKASVIGVVSDNTLNIGVKTQVENKSWQWANFDDFTLTYLGDTKVNLQVSGTAQYGTFCAPFDVTLPSGVTAYTAAKGSGDWIQLTEPGTSVVSAGTPVVLAQTGNSTISQDYYSNYAADAINSGVLQGVYTKTAVTPNDGNYLLQYKNDAAGFYLVKESGRNIGANRCYLHVDNGGARISLGEEETAIESLQTEAQGKKDGKYLVGNRVVVVKNGKAYSLNGQIIK